MSMFVIMMKMDKELKNKIADFLKESYEKASEDEKVELDEIWNMTSGGDDIKRIKQKNNLLENVNITYFIDENVIIGRNLIKNILPKIETSHIITDKNVFPLFEDQIVKDKVFFTDSINGDSLKGIISIVKNSEVPFLVGIGGGRVMDYLKYIMMNNTGKFCVAIPSSLATHVYASPKITIHPAIAELGYEKTIDGPVPDLAILDVGFLENLQKKNPRLIRAGLGDLTACITALEDWKLAEQNRTTKVNHAVFDMTEYIIEKLREIDIEKPFSEWIEDYVFIQVLLCRISGWVGSAPVSGSEHLFASAVENSFDNPPVHGELVALGTIIFAYIQNRDYGEVCNLVKKLGLPTSLSKIGLSGGQAIDALVRSKEIGIKKGRFTVVNKTNMDKSYCEGVINKLIKEDIIQV